MIQTEPEWSVTGNWSSAYHVRCKFTLAHIILKLLCLNAMHQCEKIKGKITLYVIKHIHLLELNKSNLFHKKWENIAKISALGQSLNKYKVSQSMSTILQ